MDGLREAIESGKAKAVGVCNYDAAQLEEACTLLSKHGIPLVSNQVLSPCPASAINPFTSAICSHPIAEPASLHRSTNAPPPLPPDVHSIASPPIIR